MKDLFIKYEPILRENWQLIIIVAGLLLLLGSVFNWGWVCGSESVEHKGWLRFIYSFWGEAGYRIAMGFLGFLLMASGVMIIFL